MKVDIENLYPLLFEDLLESNVKFACRFETLSTATIDIIKHCRKSLLCSPNSICLKKAIQNLKKNGFIRRAEICKLKRGSICLKSWPAFYPKNLLEFIEAIALLSCPTLLDQKQKY